MSRELLERVRNIMAFHAGRCPLSPLSNYSGTEEHCTEYRATLEDVKQALAPEKAEPTTCVHGVFGGCAQCRYASEKSRAGENETLHDARWSWDVEAEQVGRDVATVEEGEFFGCKGFRATYRGEKLLFDEDREIVELYADAFNKGLRNG